MFTEVKPKTEEAWLKLRKGIITATDMSTILGLNPYKSVKEMQEAKENPTFVGNAYTWLGCTLEPVVVVAANKLLGLNLSLFDTGARSIFMDKTLGLGATPDAGDEDCLLECKTTKPGNYLKYSNWPPTIYICQLYTQLICTDRDYGYLGIMSANLSQYSEELHIPMAISLIHRNPIIDSIFLGEIKRYWLAVKDKKQFRVDRTQSMYVELLLRMNTKMVTI